MHTNSTDPMEVLLKNKQKASPHLIELNMFILKTTEDKSPLSRILIILVNL